MTGSRYRDTGSSLISFVVTGILAVMLVEALARQGITPVFRWIPENPLVFSLNTLLALAIISFTLAVIGRWRPGLVVGFLIILLLGMVNTLKISILRVPFFAWDLPYLWQLCALGHSVVSGWITVVLMVGTITLAAFLSYRLKRNVRPCRFRTRLTALLFAAAVIGAFFWGPTTPTHSLAVNNIIWDQTENYRTNGFLLAFSMNVSPVLIRQPEEYDRGLVDRLLSHNEDMAEQAGISGRPVSLIIFMSESFSDLVAVHSQMPDDNTSPIENLQRISADYPSFRLVSPTFAGNTSLMEFEVLTGLFNAFLPEGGIPFDHYLNRKTPSLAWVLKHCGYRTVAVHPFHDWFWNRKAVYPNLGFSEYLSIDSFPGEATKGMYISDEALVDKIIETVEYTHGPYLIHAVSMQNHGPYLAGRYGNDGVNVQNNLPDWLRHELGTYLTGLRDADRQLARLIDYLSRRDEPVICLFFGDHQPSFSLAFYKACGILSEDMASEMLLFEVPGLLWANQDNILDAADIPECFSPAYLPTVVLHQMGIPLPSYMFYLQQGLTDYPVVHRGFVQDSQGRLIRLDDCRRDPFLKGLEILNFDVLFGSRFSCDPVAPVIPEQI
ncbi:MAG: LTA synthase family protein [Thermodesulfobacteriota bacterium]